MFWRFIRFFVSRKSNEFYPFDKNKQRRYLQKKYMVFFITNKIQKTHVIRAFLLFFVEFLSKIIR